MGYLHFLEIAKFGVGNSWSCQLQIFFESIFKGVRVIIKGIWPRQKKERARAHIFAGVWRGREAPNTLKNRFEKTQLQVITTPNLAISRKWEQPKKLYNTTYVT